MAQYHRTITASRVGATGAPPTSTSRRCARCGGDRTINGRTKPGKAFMCGDCKLVDPAMAKRLGLR